jgi:carboxyl-terminal processing protease
MEGTPGWDAGLIPEDRILEIDGASTRGLSLREAVERMRGQPGTAVTLRIHRPSERIRFDLRLVRDVIEPRTVHPHRVLEGGVGYIRISAFAQPTPRMLRAEMIRLLRKKPQGLILDLRGNPGGLFDAAVEVAGFFLPENSLVVSTESRGGEGPARQEYFSMGPWRNLELPLAVLINPGSASGSEIVAAALRDHGRAVLVGGRTYGKASVQSLLPLPDGGALRLTTSVYTRPSGVPIHDQGVEPDDPVAFPLRDWSRLMRGGGDLLRDPQIARAMERIRSAAHSQTHDIPTGDLPHDAARD